MATARDCECGRRIMVFQRGKGMVPAPDKNHDLCQKCWDALLASFARKAQEFFRGIMSALGMNLRR